MKKLLSVLAVIIILTAFGCAKQSKNSKMPPQLPNTYSSEMNVVCGNIKMKAMLTQTGEKNFEIKIMEPQILEPLVLSYDNGKLSAKYDDIELRTDVSKLPQSKMCESVVSALMEVLGNADVQKTYCEGIWTYSGSVNGRAFEMKQNAVTGRLVSLSVPDLDVKAEFDVK